MPAAIAKPVMTGREAGEVSRAVAAAQDYFRALFPLLEPSLEEVEPSPDKKHWLVTFSYEELRGKSLELPKFLRVPRQKFKVFKVDRVTGRVLSMKMSNGG
jgi:hypothetical protein